MQSRNVLVGIVVAVVVALAAWFWIRPAARPPAPKRIALDTGPRAPAASPAPTRSPIHYTMEGDRDPSPAQVSPEQAAKLADKYRRLARYPQTSHLIEDGLDPIAVSNVPKEQRSSPRGDFGPILIVFPAATAVEAPGTVTLYAQVVERKHETDAEKREREHQNLDIHEDRVPVRRIRGEIRNADGAPVMGVAFHDDGLDGDAAANDFFFTASITPDPDKPRDFNGDFTVYVVAETTSGKEVSATTGFSYSNPTAHLTGQYRDAIVDGNLQIEAEVVVDEPGTYQLEGTLATEKAEMLGFARKIVSLEPGTTWIPLSFYGLMFHERNVDGPYTLFSVVLTDLSVEPPQRSDVVPAALTTKPYKVSEFSNVPFNDPDRLRKAAEYNEIGRRSATQQ